MLGRASKVIFSSSNLAQKELRGRIKARLKGEDAVSLTTRLAQAKELVETLGQMKGAAMKIGQFLSMELAGFLPEEVINVLRELHDNSTFLPIEDINKILILAWGEEKFAKIEDLSPVPIAAASIGQVHKATIDGKAVVIKIQFPGVGDSIDSDISLISKLVDSYFTVSGKKIDIGPAIEEATNLLKEEVDYYNEAENIKAYRRALGDDQRFSIPEVIEEWSTKTILVLSYEEGTKLNTWLKEDIPESERQKFGHNMMDLLIKEFFEFGIVQTDSNYGNFLYNKETKRIVLLDFGATKKYKPIFRNNMRNLINIGLSGDQDALIEESFRQTLLDPKESPDTISKYLDFFGCILDMVEREFQPYDFSNLDNLTKLREMTIEFIRSIKYSPPTRDLMFLDRKIGGIYLLLRELNCSLDLYSFYQRVQKMRIE